MTEQGCHGHSQQVLALTLHPSRTTQNSKKGTIWTGKMTNLQTCKRLLIFFFLIVFLFEVASLASTNHFTRSHTHALYSTLTKISSWQPFSLKQKLLPDQWVSVALEKWKLTRAQEFIRWLKMVKFTSKGNRLTPCCPHKWNRNPIQLFNSLPLITSEI